MPDIVHLSPFVWPAEPAEPPPPAPAPKMMLPDPDSLPQVEYSAPSPFAVAPPAPALMVIGDPVSDLTAGQISTLAWDVTLFSDAGLERILDSYGLTHKAFETVRNLPLFKAEETHATKALQADPHLGVRRLAKSFLVARVETLNSMAISEMVEPAARLKAIDMLKDISGVNEKVQSQQGHSGPTININFGGALGAMLQPVIETSATFLESK